MIKDICDVFMSSKNKKTKEIYDDLIKEAIYINSKDQISEIIQMKGNKDVKIDIIINLIKEDIGKTDGILLAYNDGQELAIIPNGKIIFTDNEIIVFLREKYGYYDCDIWRGIKDKLHTVALGDNRINLYFESVYLNDKIYIGLKNEGILDIEKNDMHFELQGCNDIFIHSNITLPRNFNLKMKFKKDDITFEKILESFNYIKNPKHNQLLIKIWFYNTFFDPMIKPLLVITGVAGSGKTLLIKVIKTILFNYDNCLPNFIPEEDYSFDLMIKNNKYLFFDEIKINRYSSIMDKFKMIVTGGEGIFREKYSKENKKHKYNNNIVLASNNPQILREHDLSQRACTIELDKYNQIKETENEILKMIDDDRNKIWISITKTLQIILNNFGKYKNDNIKLTNYCRQFELANFAWKVFPEQRKDIFELFNNMGFEQETFSAEQDPVVDILEDALFENCNGDHTVFTAKQLHNLMLPKAKEKGIKMPLSIQTLGRWMASRESVLKEKYNMTKEKELHLNAWIYKFKINKEDSGGF